MNKSKIKFQIKLCTYEKYTCISIYLLISFKTDVSSVNDLKSSSVSIKEKKNNKYKLT